MANNRILNKLGSTNKVININITGIKEGSEQYEIERDKHLWENKFSKEPILKELELETQEVEVSITPMQEYGEKVVYETNKQGMKEFDETLVKGLESLREEALEQDGYISPLETQEVEYEEKIIVTEKETRNFVNDIFPKEKLESRLKELESEKRISKNCFKGEQITSAYRIKELANMSRSIYHPVWGIRPAAVIVMMQFDIVITAIWRNQFFEVINTTKDE